MIDGGTPGPGTVNWPLKNKLESFLFFNEGLNIAVWKRVFARPYALPLNEL